MPTMNRPEPGKDTQIVASNIRAILGRQALSRRKLAELTEDSTNPISAPQIARYVSGERSPDIESLRAIADALGVTIGDILEGVK